MLIPKSIATELIALSGNRRGEVAKIQLEHIGFGKRESKVQAHKTNTNGEGTPLYMPGFSALHCQLFDPRYR